MFLFLAVCRIGLAQPQTYTYAGSSFPLSPPPQAIPSGHVSVSLTLASPLQSNMAGALLTPSAWKISDGVTVLSSSDARSSLMAIVTTNDSAQIVEWDVAGSNTAGLYIESCFISFECSDEETTQKTPNYDLVYTGFISTPESWASNVAQSLPVPAALSVRPPSGTDQSQVMTFTFSDPRGWQDLDVVNVLVNTFLDARNACYVAYSRTAGVLYLVNDAGGALLPGLVLDGSGSTANSQCSVAGVGSSASGSGNTLTLTLPLSFSTSFAGNKVVYTAARDVAGDNCGWQPMGVWQVPGIAQSTTTAVVGMTPGGGAGLSSTAYTFSFSDSKGYQDLGVENILINGALDGRQGCYLAYARSFNVLYLANDNGGGLLPGQSLNSTGSLSNSQCMVGWGSNPVAGSGNGLSLSLNIGFTAGFGPNLIFYLAARDGNESNNTGWQAMGTWVAQ
jgi:hypothetical protein